MKTKQNIIYYRYITLKQNCLQFNYYFENKSTHSQVKQKAYKKNYKVYE